MPFRWHVNLPGPVAYSRPMRRRGKKPNGLIGLLIWFTVKPLELMIRGLAKLFGVLSLPNTRHPVSYSAPSYRGIGWHHTQYGPLWWNGTAWIRPDGRSAF